MRKAITTLAAALAVAAAAAQPASADDPYSQFWSSSSPPSQKCQSSYQYGVYGAYGAWGNYVDGCTASVKCPTDYATDYCTVDTAQGVLSNNDTVNYYGASATCNARLRILSEYGSVLWFRDATSSGSPTCVDQLPTGITLKRGQWATVQANGVRKPDPGGARVTGYVVLGTHACSQYYTCHF